MNGLSYALSLSLEVTISFNGGRSYASLVIIHILFVYIFIICLPSEHYKCWRDFRTHEHLTKYIIYSESPPPRFKPSNKQTSATHNFIQHYQSHHCETRQWHTSTSSMVTQLNILRVQQFNRHGNTNTIAQRWQRWKTCFDNFIVASRITDPDRQKAVLVHLLGPKCQDIYQTLTIPQIENLNQYQAAIQALDQHFPIQKNVPFEWSIFPKTV